MKICIVGAGAMGTLFTAFLARGMNRSGSYRARRKTREPEEVILLDKHSERVGTIQKKGIRIRGSSEFRVSACVETSADKQSSAFKITCEPEEIGIVDLVIVFVKAYDTARAARKIKSLVSKNTIVLSLQNGLNNLETLSRIFGEDRIVGGTTAQGATYLGPGEVYHAGKGETILGAMSREQRPARRSLGGGGAKSREISKIFNQAGIETKITDNLESAIWSKLVLNSAINPLAALTRRKNGDLVKEKNLSNLLSAVAEETGRVAQAKGIKLLYSNPKNKVIESCVKTAQNTNSMLQDVLQNKQTEIDYLNGAIVSEGRKVSQPTPLNEICWVLVKSLEKGGMEKNGIRCNKDG